MVVWKPRNYQLRILQFLHGHLRAMVAAGAGLGKTVTLLTYLRFLLGHAQQGEKVIRRALVVAPKRVALSVWKQECRKWLHLHNLDIEVIHGNTWREDLLNCKAEIVVVTYAQLATIERKVKGEVQKYKGIVDLYTDKTWPFDCMVLDESTKIKSPSSDAFRAVAKLKKRVPRIYLMSGTPAPNGLLDLWPQMAAIDVGHDLLGELGTSMTRFKEKFFTSDYMGWKWELQPWAEKRIHEIIKPKVISLRSDDYLELPPYHVNEIRIDMPAKALRAYENLEREAFLQLSETAIDAVSAAALTTKLRQFAQGFLYTDDSRTTFEVLHEAKLEALDDLIEESAGNPVLLAYDFRADLERLKKHFGKRLTAMADARNPVPVIDAWNEGKLPILAIHPKSAAHGLNLQHGGNIVAWYGNTWSSEEYDQLNARLHRTGQKSRVFVHHLIVNGTIDQHVFEVVAGKRAVQDVLMQAVKLRKAA